MAHERVLDYRPCVGIMLFNSDNSVWVGKRADMPGEPEGSGTWWQMPQGGIDAGEDPRDAAKRELAEETGVTSVEIVAESSGWFTYDLPEDLIGVAWDGKYRGQKQKWFAMRFLGQDSEINIVPSTEHRPEFDSWKWVKTTELVDLAVTFKRDVYNKVVQEFGWLVR